MDASTLWIFMSPLIIGVEGFRLMYFHLLSFGMMEEHSLTVDLTVRCSFLVMSWSVEANLLSEMKEWTFSLYSSIYIIIMELPLSALVTMALASSCFLLIWFMILFSLLAFLLSVRCFSLCCLYNFLEVLCYTVSYTFMFVYGKLWDNGFCFKRKVTQSVFIFVA